MDDYNNKGQHTDDEIKPFFGFGGGSARSQYAGGAVDASENYLPMHDGTFVHAPSMHVTTTGPLDPLHTEEGNGLHRVGKNKREGTKEKGAVNGYVKAGER